MTAGRLLRNFNAEILSHNNVGRRIHYVDLIRRDCAEARHIDPGAGGERDSPGRAESVQVL